MRLMTLIKLVKLLCFEVSPTHYCTGDVVGDEYHYIFEYTEFINESKLYFDFVHINRHNIIKYSNLMSSKSIYTLSKLCKFIRIVNKRICPLC